MRGSLDKESRQRESALRERAALGPFYAILTLA